MGATVREGGQGGPDTPSAQFSAAFCLSPLDRFPTTTTTPAALPAKARATIHGRLRR